MSMRIYTAISRLLDYPDTELFDHLDELRHAVAGEPGLEPGEREAVTALIDHMAGEGLLDAQGEYVNTFDVTPEHTLYLTHHTLGDSRDRGPALVELGELYKSSGVEPERELPDYLPLILEYCAGLEPFEAQVFLGQAVDVLSLLADNLEQAQSPYAPLIRIVENRGRLARSAA